MRTLFFSLRNAKEILRDKITIFFGLGFPLILLLLLSIIQSNIPVSLFEIQDLTPGIAVFGLSFMTLFSAMLISKDRCSSFMFRLFTSPMKSTDFILGYTIPMIPISILQTVICFVVALLIGLKWSANLLLAIVVIIPSAIFFIALGLLCGSLLNDKQVGGICGAVVTNVSGWLSGIWFDLDLIGGTFKDICNLLPFVHGVNAAKYAVHGDYSKIMPELFWVIGYAVAILVAAILIFTYKMKNGSKTSN